MSPTDSAAAAAGQAPQITSDVPGSFPHGVFTRRHPALIEQVREAFPYGPEQHRALDALAAELADGVIAPLPPSAPDRDQWHRWDAPVHLGRPWREAPFLWAESYFYRRLLGAVDYVDPGPWQGVDPFAPFKQPELDGPAVDRQCAAAADLADASPAERDQALLTAALWGNRADLGFRLSLAGVDREESVSDLVVDDSPALWSLLDAPERSSPGGARCRPGAASDPDAGDGPPDGADRAAGTVCLVADNAGPELVPDLMLLDHLLTTGRADRVVLQVKPHPYYVSDATTADVVAAVRRLRQASGAAGTIGERLWRAAADGRLVVRTHPFFCAPLPYRRMPPDLRAEFATYRLTLMKGDLNYRRLVEDRWWPPTTPFAERTAYFPGPVAALRTLKSDVVVGVPPAVLAALDAAGTPWRTTGTHALVQLGGPGADRQG